MSTSTVGFNINANTDQAVGAIQNLEKTLLKFAGAAVAFLGAREIVSFFEDATKEAINQENAINSLNTALALAGDYTDGASKAMQDFANEMQSTTVFADDLILSQVALAKNLGATNDQATELVKAAANLSAATGVDLNTATEQLGRSLAGTAGGLAKTIPLVRGLTEEQLKAGAAIGLVNERFNGAAAAQVNTFGGALAQLTNKTSDVKEEFGALITQNPIIIEAIKIVSDTFTKLSKYIGENRVKIIEWINSFLIGALKYIPGMIKGLGNIVQAFGGLIKVMNLAKFTFLSFIRDFPLLKQINELFDKVLGSFAAGLARIGKALGLNTDELEAFSDHLAGLDSDDSFKLLTNDLDASLKATEEADQALEALFKTLDTGAENSAAYLEDLIKKLAQAKNNAKAPVNSSQGALGEFSTKKPEEKLKGIFETFNDDFEKNIRSFGETSAIASKGIETGTLILQGKAGAQKAISGAAALAADYFVPGIGAVVGPFVDALQQGPEFVKAQVNEFVDALPQFLEALIEAIPVFIETLVRRAPDIIQGIVHNIPTLIDALVQALPDLISAFIESVPQIATAFISEIPRIIESLIEAMPNLIIEIVKAIGEGILDAISSGIKTAGGLFGHDGFLSDLNPIKDSGGGVGHVVNEIIEGVGGLFGNRTMVQSGNQSSQPIHITVKVGQDELARALYNLNKSGFRTA